VIALIISLPLFFSGGQLIGGATTGLPLWSTWWLPHAITYNYNLVYSDYILFPLKTNLLPTLSFTASGLFWLLQGVFNASTAYHALLPIYGFLNAAVSYHWLLNKGAALGWAILGGLIVAYNPFTWTLASQGELALLGIFVVPLALLAWERFREQPNYRYAMLLTLSLYLVVLTSLYYWTFLFSLFLPSLLWAGLRHPQRASLFEAGWGGVVCLLLLLAIYPLPSLLWMNLFAEYPPPLLAQGYFTATGSLWLFVVGLLFTSMMALRVPHAQHNQHLFSGVLLLLHLVLALLPAWQPLVLLGVVPAPHLTFSAVWWLPVALCGVLLIATTWQFTTRWVGRGSLVLVVIFVSGWWQPLPMQPYTRSTMFTEIAQERENYRILTLPISYDSLARRVALPGAEGLGAVNVAGERLIEGVLHGKGVIGGLTTQLFLTEVNQIAALPMLNPTLDPNLSAADQAIQAERLQAMLRRWRVAYIVLNTEQLSVAEQAQAHQWLAQTQDYCLVATEAQREFWRARWHPLNCPKETP
jgi:hypothetical protein